MLKIQRVFVIFLLLFVTGGCKGGPTDVGEGVPAATAEGVDVLSVVPASADVVVYVPNLAAVAAGLEGFANSVAGDGPGFLPPLASALAEAEGVDPNGTAVLFITDLTAAGGGGGPIFALVPVDDYSAFIETMGGDEEDPAELPLPIGLKAYSRRFGDYALLGVDKTLLEQLEVEPEDSFRGGTSPLATAVIDNSQVTVFLDMEAIGPLMLMGLAQAEVAMQMGGVEAMGWESIFEFYRRAIELLSRDATWVAFGVDLSPEILGMSFSADFRAGSPLAEALGSGPAPAEPLWAQLPARSFLVGAVASFDGTNLGPLFEEVLGSSAEVGSGFMSLIGPAMALMEHVNTSAMAYYPGDGGAATTMVGVMQSASPAVFLEAYKAYVEGLNGQQLDIGTSLQPMSFRYTTAYAQASAVIAGQTVDHFSIHQAMPTGQTDAVHDEMLELMSAFGQTVGTNAAGETGVLSEGWMTTVDDRVIMLNTPDESLFQEVLNVEPGSSLADSEAVRQARAWQLREGSAIELVADGAVVAQWFASMVDGEAPPAPVVPGVMPAAVFGNIEENAVGGRLVVPVALIRTFSEIAKNMTGR